MGAVPTNTKQKPTSQQPIESSKPPKPKISTTMVLSVLVILLLITTGFLAYQNYQLRQQLSQKTTEPKQEANQVSQEKTETSKTYYLEVTLKSKDKEPPENIDYASLTEYLQHTLDLLKQRVSTDEINWEIAYDTREGNPHSKDASKYNFNYYLMLYKGQIDTSKTYEDEYVQIKVSLADEKLESYIIDPDYCETDNDCIIRTDFCTYGSFNYYHRFQDIWGCGPPSDETGYTFQYYDEDMGCKTDVKYSGSKCLENKCVGQNREVSCEE